MQLQDSEPLENGLPRATRQGTIIRARHARAVATREGLEVNIKNTRMKIKWRKRTEHMKKIASARRIVVTFK
ncbi:hypothetical protein HanRHA438_Chr16g0749251 [Helianthus annuus]|nr:hypothetical protein HanPSC8_Chr16g0706491 [Helianthus annuus]KAJ0834928.1 hypothetical protein HanRHA438_Chr16g0749251 [Helianthus annuus]